MKRLKNRWAQFNWMMNHVCIGGNLWSILAVLVAVLLLGSALGAFIHHLLAEPEIITYPLKCGVAWL